MISSKMLAFALAVVSSPLVMAATPKQVPFIPSTVQQPDAHAGRFGLITTISYGRYGQKSTSTQVIDLDAYIKSGATKLVVGAQATKLAAMNSYSCSTPGLDGTCGDYDNDVGSNDGNDGNGGAGPNINPNGSGPGAGPPSIPDPPILPVGDWNIGTIDLIQYYDHGTMQQTTTYNRTVTPNPNGGGTAGPWGPPVTVDGPAKKGH